MQTITTFVTYEDQAEEAVEHYTSIFPDSRVLSVRRYGEAGPMPAGTFMTAEFEQPGGDSWR
jgi:predicted 3-demethylubiquinone-9 3-methyltransferase (glyoxalase superfamily)